MNPNKIPYQPISYFLSSFTAGQRRIFIAIFIMVLAAAVWTGFSHTFPTWFTLNIQEYTETVTEPVEVLTLEHNYLELNAPFDAYRQKIYYEAGLMDTPLSPLIFFWICQLCAWALLLAIGQGYVHAF